MVGGLFEWAADNRLAASAFSAMAKVHGFEADHPYVF